VCGNFGYSERKNFPYTWGVNEKAGISAVEFDKYLVKSIMLLYPDMEDTPQKRVIIKVDSGPGRTNIKMLAYIRALGVYCVPGVLNATRVSQEIYQSCGLLKSIF